MPVTDVKSFKEQVLDARAEQPVVVVFWAAWCPPCRTLKPMLEAVAQAAGVGYVPINQMHHPHLGQRYGVRSLPTVIAFRDGREVDRFTGSRSRAALEAWVEGIG